MSNSYLNKRQELTFVACSLIQSHASKNWKCETETDREHTYTGKEIKKATLIAVPMDYRMERANYENTSLFCKTKILRYFTE